MKRLVKQYTFNDMPYIWQHDCFEFIVENALDEKEKKVYTYWVTKSDRRALNYLSRFVGCSREYVNQITKRLYFAGFLTREDIEGKNMLQRGIDTWEQCRIRSYHCDWGVSGLVKRVWKAFRKWRKIVKKEV